MQSTAWYKSGGQIIIEWDEALDSDTSGIDGGSGGHVPTIVVSSALKASPQHDSAPVDTVGILRSIEDTYGLPLPRRRHGGRQHRRLAEPHDTDDHNAPLRQPLRHHTSTRPPPPASLRPAPTTSPYDSPYASSYDSSYDQPLRQPLRRPYDSPYAARTPTSTTVAVAPEVGTSAQGLTASVSPAPAGGTVQFTVDGWVMGDAIPVSSEGTAVMALYLD